MPCWLGLLFAVVARALRQVAESKARAQDEAAEWKRKYELEIIRSKQLGRSPSQLLAVGNRVYLKSYA